MIAHRVRRGEPLAGAVGRVLCHDLRADGKLALRKGEVLRDEHLPVLAALAWDELHLLEMEPGDLHEEEAGRGVAAAVAGHGVEMRPVAGGAWPLVASWRGILQVDAELLRRVNSVPGLAVYTLYHGQVVEERETVARAKVVPLVIEAAPVREVEALAGQAQGVLRVRPFLPMRVGAVVREHIGESGMARFHEGLAEKLAWFGSELLPPLSPGASAESLASAVEALLARGAQLIVVAGVKAMDPLDPAFEALRRLDVRLERLGVPAHPGSLLWMARLWEVPILGMPGCGLFSQATVFDLVLPRLLAGERMEAADLADLGHGGLLTRDMTFRFPPYRAARARGRVDGLADGEAE